MLVSLLSHPWELGRYRQVTIMMCSNFVACFPLSLLLLLSRTWYYGTTVSWNLLRLPLYGNLFVRVLWRSLGLFCYGIPTIFLISPLLCGLPFGTDYPLMIGSLLILAFDLWTALFVKPMLRPSFICSLNVPILLLFSTLPLKLVVGLIFQWVGTVLWISSFILEGVL